MDPTHNLVSNYKFNYYNGDLVSTEIMWIKPDGETGNDVASVPRANTKSPYTTNKIWQLIALDWSERWYEDAVETNSKGLPTRFTRTVTHLGSGAPLAIEYECD